MLLDTNNHLNRVIKKLYLLVSNCKVYLTESFWVLKFCEGVKLPPFTNNSSKMFPTRAEESSTGMAHTVMQMCVLPTRSARFQATKLERVKIVWWFATLSGANVWCELGVRGVASGRAWIFIRQSRQGCMHQQPVYLMFWTRKVSYSAIQMWG